MKSAYPTKLRFVDDPIATELIPDSCRDEYGVDAAALVKHLAALVYWMAAQMESESFYFVAGDFIAKAKADIERREK